MKKFLFSVLMAALAIPMTQAIEKTGLPLMLTRGHGQVASVQIKSSDFSKIGKYMSMTKGENAVTWDFEDEAQMDNWMALDNDGDGYNWYQHINTGSGNLTTHGGDGVIASESYHNNDDGTQGGTALTPDNWLITPVVNLGGTLTLWACGQDPSYAEEVFAIYVCVGTPTSMDAFEKVGVDVTTTGEMTEYKFDLSAYAGQEGCIAIRHYNVTDKFILVVDDITIDPDEVYVPDPTTPEELTAYPGDVYADVEWTDTDDAAWNLRYRVYDPNTTSTIHWSAEADESLDDWMIWDADGDGNSWGITTLGESAPDGTRVFYSASVGNDGALNPDEYLITPEVEIKEGGMLTFWAGTYYFPENFAVYLIPDVDNTESWVEIMGETEAVDGYYQGAGQYYTIDLTPYANLRGNARFAFRHFDSEDQYYFFLDDISVVIPGNPEGEWTYVNGLDEPFYTIEGLTPETTYEVQVQAYNEEKESDWTESTIFTTTREITPAPEYDITTGKYNEKYVEITCVDEDAVIYYRVQFENGTWSDWAVYDGKMMFTENGHYNIEAYATSPEKENSGIVPEEFIVSDCTAVSELNGQKAVAGVRYFNAMGQEMAQPNGMTIVVTTYTDGTKVANKVMK